MTIKYLDLLGNNKLSGCFLIVVAVFSEVIALFTQYALGFEPCSLCVQMRASVALLGVAGAILMLAGNGKLSKPLILSGIAISIAGITETLSITTKGLLIERGEMISTCSNVSPFPAYLPLDSWLPSVFKDYGTCGKSPVLAFDFTIMELSYYGFIATAIAISILSIAMIIKKWDVKLFA